MKRMLLIFFLSLSFVGFGQPEKLYKTNEADSILNFNFPGMKIGIAENENGPTGTTVFYFPDGVMGAADVRGGATGTVNASAVSRGYESKMIDAVVFSGGSWYGLSAATGVANEIKDIKAKEGNVDYIAGILGGIIYDVGVRRFTRETPDDELGRKAINNAKTNVFPLGARGAGRFAMQGYYFYDKKDGKADDFSGWPHSGQGAAFGEIGETKIAVFTVVNALGTIVDRKGNVVRCHRNFIGEDCPTAAEMIRNASALKQLDATQVNGPTNNTTLTLVVTNKKLPFWALQRLATQVHTSMGRAIQPFSTQFDGDVLYAVSTNEIENRDISPIDLAVVASELAWDAVLNSLPKLPNKPSVMASNALPKSYNHYKGEYEFYGGGILLIDVDDRGLWAKFRGDGKIYFDENRVYRLHPTTNGQFIIDAPAQDVIQFDSKSDEVYGVTINPGAWAIKSQRIKK
ncbi:P1 family peptidase [Geojedonia litorea]|uniref:P1 family peptidase n=1 Tax=Geojedonia litorea TaxID=1268269 RepID=A0ABV9N1S8_9FLAO